MAVKVSRDGNTTYHFFTSMDSTIDNADPFDGGAVIRKVANGFTLVPYGESAYSDPRTHVFQDATEMATWLRKKYADKAK